MSEIQIPPYLQHGDKVIILTPAGKIEKSILKALKKRLEEWALKPVIAAHAGKSHGLYAGTIDERAEDLQQALDDPDVKAIFCSRGGYGAVHLIDRLDLSGFCSSPKWLIGYSDITALHCMLQSYGFASLHAPMAAHLTTEPQGDPCTLLLKEMLFGKLPGYAYKSHKLNKYGNARGVLRGGNLSVFYGLRATPYDIPAAGTILFVEDVNERPHVVERIFYNLKLGGVLDRLSGVIFGQFTEYIEDKSLGKPLYDALSDLLEPYRIPVCFNFPVGHVQHNLPMLCGAEVGFVVDKKGVKLKF